MRVASCSLENFASYGKLEFDFTDQGLTLISGATGSGKSTLCDAIPWVLFGTTAKGGSVTEILSWPGDKVTRGTIYFENGLEITRVRGKTKDNDLYFLYENETGTVSVQRGKDIQDTQKLINSVLGITPELYLSGAYFHEFSQTAQFFTTTPKNRRALCEQIVDLSLAIKLQIKIKDEFKTLTSQRTEIINSINSHQSNISMLERLQTSESTKASRWEDDHQRNMTQALEAYDRFESNRKQIIQKSCKTCGTLLENPKEVVDITENPYIKRISDLEIEDNPYDGILKDYSIEIQNKQQEIKDLEIKGLAISSELFDLEILSDVVSDFRSTSVSNTISFLETTTNQLLTEHFDGECKVYFTIESDDKLNVTMHKDGNACSFTQLSKGQRQLLKLCFGVGVMKAVQNHHGVKFDQVFFDEALDGLDEVMKLKAYGLLETLSQEYSSVFVVEHSEGLKAMFTNRFTVELVNGESQIASIE